MDFYTLARKRRSIRSFTDEPVTDEQLTRLLEMACHAPSGGNGQPWKFIVVRNRELIEKISPACCPFGWIAQARAVIVVCIDLVKAKKRYGERGLALFSIEDTAAAAQNILLGAEEMGLASCWVGAFDEVKCSAHLGLDEVLRPVIMLPIGHPAGAEPPARRIKPLADVVEYRD